MSGFHAMSLDRRLKSPSLVSGLTVQRSVRSFDPLLAREHDEFCERAVRIDKLAQAPRKKAQRVHPPILVQTCYSYFACRNGKALQDIMSVCLALLLQGFAVATSKV